MSPFGEPHRFRPTKISMCLLGVVILLGSAPPAFSQNVDIARIRADWQKRFEKSHNVYYELDGNITYAKGMLATNDGSGARDKIPKGGFPEKELSKPLAASWSIDFDNLKFRKYDMQHVCNVSELTFSKREQLVGFDGTRSWSTHPYEKKIINFFRSKWDTDYSSSIDEAVFFAHGVFPIKRLLYKELHRQTEDSIKITTVGRKKVQGRECEVIKVEPKKPLTNRNEIRLYVDPARQSAVTRYESYQFGIPTLQTDVDYVFDKRHKLWLPSRITVLWHELRWFPEDPANPAPFPSEDLGKPKGWHVLPVLGHVIDLKVVKRQVNQGFAKDAFDPPLKPGQVVLDHENKLKFHVVESDDGVALKPFLGRVQVGGAAFLE